MTVGVTFNIVCLVMLLVLWVSDKALISVNAAVFLLRLLLPCLRPGSFVDIPQHLVRAVATEILRERGYGKIGY